MSAACRLDTERRELGLSIGELADVARVNERTVNRWMRSELPLNQDVFDQLAALREQMLDMVDMAVEHVTSAVESGPLPLLRYRTQKAYEASEGKAGMPLGAHAMMVAWTARALEEEGVETDPVWVEDLV